MAQETLVSGTTTAIDSSSNPVTNSFGLSTDINYEKLNNVNYTSSASNHPIISTTVLLIALKSTSNSVLLALWLKPLFMLL
jgi:hypothetical protein